MKYFILATTILSSSAYAADLKPYVGGDYNYTHASYQSDSKGLAEDNLSGGDIHIGARVHKNFGVELGYNQTENATKHNVLGSGLDSKVKLSGVTLDALGYLPVYKDVELIGTVGLAHTKATASVTGFGSDHATETKPRFGAGAQYQVTPNVNIRGIVRYQVADFDSTLDNTVVSSLGVNYSF